MTTLKEKRQEGLEWGYLRPSWYKPMPSNEFPLKERKRRRAEQKRAKASRKRNR